MAGSAPAVAVEFSEADYPGLFRAADAVSRAGQERHVWLARSELALLTAAAIVGAVVSVVPTVSGQVGAVAVAVLLIGAALVRSVSRSTRPENRWFEGRALDGYNIHIGHPSQFRRFTSEVVPILRERGLVRAEYESSTLRGNLGLPIPENRYTRARQRPSLARI